jgi:hypothetical protein
MIFRLHGDFRKCTFLKSRHLRTQRVKDNVTGLASGTCGSCNRLLWNNARTPRSIPVLFSSHDVVQPTFCMNVWLSLCQCTYFCMNVWLSLCQCTYFCMNVCSPCVSAHTFRVVTLVMQVSVHYVWPLSTSASYSRSFSWRPSSSSVPAAGA